MAEIQFAPGAEDVALAVMISDMLKGNLQNSPGKEKDFDALSAGVYINAEDICVDMTMVFDKGQMTVHKGREGDPDIEIATDSTSLLELTHLNIKMGLPYYFDKPGREVVKKLFKGDLKIKGMFTHLPSLTRLTKVMSVT